MYNLKLSTPNLELFIKGLLTNHMIKIRTEVMDMEQNILTELAQDMIMDGQVNVDGAADISRSASLELLDPNRTLSFDSNSPMDGSLFLDRMIRISYEVFSYEGYAEWVSIPIFTGPISKLNRTNEVVQVEAMGKEILAKRPAWRTKNYAIGTKRTSVIKELMTNVGEDKFALMDWDKKTANPYGVTRETDVWTLARRMAAGQMMYYDGAGTLVLRPWLSRPVFTFRGNNDDDLPKSLMSNPQVEYDVENVKNIIWVVGGTPKGEKYPLQKTAYAQASHPLSAQSLGRNGVSRHLVEKIEDQDLLRQADVDERANTRLAQALMGSLNANFDSLPIPFLEFGDVVTIKTDQFGFDFTLDQFTIPLTTGNNQSNGWNAKRSVNKTAIRRKK